MSTLNVYRVACTALMERRIEMLAAADECSDFPIWAEECRKEAELCHLAWIELAAAVDRSLLKAVA